MIDFSDGRVERTFDQASGLLDFDCKRNFLQRKINNYFLKYLGKKIDLFPHGLKGIGQIREKEEWAKEMNELMRIRINIVLNDKNYIWVSKTIEEVV